MAKYMIQQLKVGDYFEEKKLISRESINQFANVSGDFSPIHMNEEYAKQTKFGGCISHGMLLGAYISKIIGMELPGEGTIYVSQDMKFCTPVYENAEIVINVKVKEIDINRNRVILSTVCTDLEGKIVLKGEAVVIPPEK